MLRNMLPLTNDLHRGRESDRTEDSKDSIEGIIAFPELRDVLV